MEHSKTKKNKIDKSKWLPLLDKWQWTYYFGRDWIRLDMGWKEIRFGVFKFVSLPGEGEMIQKKHYKGFIIHFYVWLPFSKI